MGLFLSTFFYTKISKLNSLLSNTILIFIFHPNFYPNFCSNFAIFHLKFKSDFLPFPSSYANVSRKGSKKPYFRGFQKGLKIFNFQPLKCHFFPTKKLNKKGRKFNFRKIKNSIKPLTLFICFLILLLFLNRFLFFSFFSFE